MKLSATDRLCPSNGFKHCLGIECAGFILRGNRYYDAPVVGVPDATTSI